MKCQQQKYYWHVMLFEWYVRYSWLLKIWKTISFMINYQHSEGLMLLSVWYFFKSCIDNKWRVEINHCQKFMNFMNIVFMNIGGRKYITSGTNISWRLTLWTQCTFYMSLTGEAIISVGVATTTPFDKSIFFSPSISAISHCGSLMCI